MRTALQLFGHAVAERRVLRCVTFMLGAVSLPSLGSRLILARMLIQLRELARRVTHICPSWHFRQLVDTRMPDIRESSLCGPRPFSPSYGTAAAPFAMAQGGGWSLVPRVLIWFQPQTRWQLRRPRLRPRRLGLQPSLCGSLLVQGYAQYRPSVAILAQAYAAPALRFIQNSVFSSCPS